MSTFQACSTATKPIIQIPLIKRHNPDLPLGISHPQLQFLCEEKNHFQTFKIQLQNANSQLELGTLNSGFTKVSSTDDDCNETFRREQTRATFLPIDPQFYMLNLQKLLNLMQKPGLNEQKDQSEFLMSTKNILRNICNAQNQYIMFNESAQKVINLHSSQSVKFKQWVNKLRFHTFEEFQRVWSSNQRPVFRKLYKRLCRKFYVQNAIPYIMNSRIRNRETKKAHIRYLYRFLQGVENPDQFYYFKQKQKDKNEQKEPQIRIK